MYRIESVDGCADNFFHLAQEPPPPEPKRGGKGDKGKGKDRDRYEDRYYDRYRGPFKYPNIFLSHLYELASSGLEFLI